MSFELRRSPRSRRTKSFVARGSPRIMICTINIFQQIVSHDNVEI